MNIVLQSIKGRNLEIIVNFNRDERTKFSTVPAIHADIHVNIEF